MNHPRADLFRLDGKVVLVAGGAGYLGQPVCRALVAHGAAVVVADLRRDIAESFVATLPREKGLAVSMDIASEGDIKAAVQRVLDRFGRVDAAVNMTFGSVGHRVEELTAEDFDRANRVNLTGAFLFAREGAGAMRAGGSLVLYSSMYGHVSPDPRIYEPPQNPNPIEYGTGKAAVEQMVRYLAVHFASRSIRVNGIAPGPFPNTEQQRNTAFMERLARKAPLGRIGHAHETAGAVVFLVSDASSYVTGHILNVDGGWTAW